MALLLSVKPKWCNLIFSGKKTIEIRKNKPKLDVPFKCYVYETKAFEGIGENKRKGQGKIIGEFVCDRLDKYRAAININLNDFDMFQCTTRPFDYSICEASCVPVDNLKHYVSNGKTGFYDFYGWHISSPKIYATPKILEEFSFPPEKFCKKELCGGCRHDQIMGLDGDYAYDCEWKRPIENAPQSWCYVNELESEDV